ncbi:MAG TPA: hypothetical protein VNV44_15530 [Solirubrobacteraceae bacterium]|jgi:hypothetical protein|nr:hypothetical protein [Solirubrobacteraceae bacterium]
MSSAESPVPALDRAAVPTPPAEWRAWALAALVAAAGVTVLVAVLTGAVGRRATQAPPPLPASTATPLAASGAAPSAARSGGSIVARSTPAQQRQAARHLSTTASSGGAPRIHIERRWMEGFYPIYATAQATFGVNWLLLASIHMQESAFSTAPGTYHGLNFAGCCGGPMQFNVTNGPVSTWDLVGDSYLYAPRPASYDHMTAKHPSIYDDFDAVMAAAHLLSSDGARYSLDDSAWLAAYDYYGHDTTGVLYADQVLARAIGWSQHGFCINCGVSEHLVSAVQAAYGVPVQAALEAAARTRARHAARHGRGARSHRG